jgi:hypothetical protein
MSCIHIQPRRYGNLVWVCDEVSPHQPKILFVIIACLQYDISCISLKLFIFVFQFTNTIIRIRYKLTNLLG